MTRDEERIHKKCCRLTYKEKGRKDDRKQDRKTRAKETWKILTDSGRVEGQGDMEQEDHQS